MPASYNSLTVCSAGMFRVAVAKLSFPSARERQPMCLKQFHSQHGLKHPYSLEFPFQEMG